MSKRRTIAARVPVVLRLETEAHEADVGRDMGKLTGTGRGFHRIGVHPACMTAPRSRRTLAAGAAGFAALGAAGAFAVMNTAGANPVVNFTPAAATDGATTTTAAPAKASADAAPGDGTGCDHDGDHQPLDDATAAKVKAAAEKAVTGATVEHTGHDRSNPDGYVAMMERADGTHVLVHEDANFAVTKVEDPAPPRGPGRPGGHHRGDDPAPAAA
jgi:hypothetical protein